MTPKAQAAYGLYRDLGPSRTLQRVADLQGRAPKRGAGQLARWSRAYEWQRLTAEHDHAALRKALGKREVLRERATQMVVDAQSRLMERLLTIAFDSRVLPVMDRQGMQIKDADDEPIYKPLVRASTQAETIKWLLSVVGHVPVKRVEMLDRTAESLDEAAAVIEMLSDEEVAMLAAPADDEPDQP